MIFFICVLFLLLFIWRKRPNTAEGFAGFPIHFLFGAGVCEPQFLLMSCTMSAWTCCFLRRWRELPPRHACRPLWPSVVSASRPGVLPPKPLDSGARSAGPPPCRQSACGLVPLRWPSCQNTGGKALRISLRVVTFLF